MTYHVQKYFRKKRCTCANCKDVNKRKNAQIILNIMIYHCQITRFSKNKSNIGKLSMSLLAPAYCSICTLIVVTPIHIKHCIFSKPNSKNIN